MDNTISRLEQVLSEGVLVDAGWLQARGWSRSQIAYYVRARAIEKAGPGAYWRRPPAADELPGWRAVVKSLQGHHPPLLTLGGQSALHLRGLAQTTGANGVELFGAEPPPYWVHRLSTRPLVFTRIRLFDNDPLGDMEAAEADGLHLSLVDGLLASTPERALLEVLEKVPGKISFAAADDLMTGLGGLDPDRLSTLLAACRSVKVKRLALWFADRHGHAWASSLRRYAIDLGAGKRVLEVGGRFDRRYQITVPRTL